MTAAPPIRCLAPRPWARRRLVCLPYAGGGPPSFRTWADELPDDVEVWAAQLPGHAGRLAEPLADDLRAVAFETATAISALPRLPLALFGHSMGAWLALECARDLERAGNPPRLVAVSGRAAPAAPPSSPFSELADDAFVDELSRRYGGLPPEVAASAEIMEVFLPVLRADVRMLERFRPDPEPIAARIHVLVAERDPAMAEGAAESWRAATRGGFEVHAFAGGHFFVDTERTQVLELLASLF